LAESVFAEAFGEHLHFFECRVFRAYEAVAEEEDSCLFLVGVVEDIHKEVAKIDFNPEFEFG